MLGFCQIRTNRFLMNLHRAEPAAGGNRVPGGAGALPCGPLWPWITPLPTQGGQPPCGRCRGLPTAAAAGTDALRWTKPAACPRSGCLAFEKLNPGEGEGLGVGHGQPQAVAHPRHRRTRARNPLRLGDRGSRGPVREGAPGAQPWGSGGASPLPGSALGAAGTAQAKRRGPWTPPSGGYLCRSQGRSLAHETFRSLVC